MPNGWAWRSSSTWPCREADIGKRSDFERVEHDFYRTPAEAIPFLRPHLPARFSFCEPCAGDGRLIRHLEAVGGRCAAAYDIEPQGPGIVRRDARTLLGADLRDAELIITNPPWTREILHPLIMRFSRLGGAWALWDANWIFTDGGAQFMDYRRGRNVIHDIVTIGRLKWIEGSSDTGKDDAAWFRIGAAVDHPPRFHPRLDVT